MEENRLKPMPEHYDVNLFNQIYKDTEKLRRKLAWQIDARRLGYDTKEVLSWFDNKFIQCFRIYHDQMEPNLLKAHIIKALSFFKMRILRYAYSERAKLHNTVDVTTVYIPGHEWHTELETDKNVLLTLCMDKLRADLSYDAFQVLDTEIRTPLYVIRQMSEKGKSSNAQIPSRMIAEYLGWNEKNCLKRVCQAREEIRNAIGEAREYFKDKAV